MGGQLSTTFSTSFSSCIAEQVIGKLRIYLQQLVRDSEVTGTPEASLRCVVRDP